MPSLGIKGVLSFFGVVGVAVGVPLGIKHLGGGHSLSSSSVAGQPASGSGEQVTQHRQDAVLKNYCEESAQEGGYGVEYTESANTLTEEERKQIQEELKRECLSIEQASQEN